MSFPVSSVLILKLSPSPEAGEATQESPPSPDSGGIWAQRREQRWGGASPGFSEPRLVGGWSQACPGALYLPGRRADYRGSPRSPSTERGGPAPEPSPSGNKDSQEMRGSRQKDALMFCAIFI